MININDNFFSASPKALDQKSGVFESGTWRPYTSVAEALSVLTSAIRHRGLTVLVTVSGTATEYWFRDGIADVDLIEKTSTAGLPTALAVTANNGPYTLTWNAARILQHGSYGHFEVYVSDGAGGYSREQIPITLTLAGSGDAAASYLFSFDATHPQALIIVK